MAPAPQIVGLLVLTGTLSVVAQEMPGFDFTAEQVRAGWRGNGDISQVEASRDGLTLHLNGQDPQIIGPSVDFPADAPLFLKLRLKSESPGVCQVFYLTDHAREEKSVSIPVRGGGWEDLQAMLPALGPKHRFRLDPPGTSGKVTIASLKFETRVVLNHPEWQKPAPPVIGKDALALQSGNLEIVHTRDMLGGFVLRVAGRDLAIGGNRPLIGYIAGGQQRWLDLAKNAKVQVRGQKDSVSVSATCKDEDGGEWKIEQRFKPASKGVGAIDVQTKIKVSRDRDIVYLPVLTIFPGAGSFGETKGQALFAGLEYLENEPSSSEADVIGPASKRQVPDTLKITFPLMSVQANGRYVGLIWEPAPDVCAVFDSPDRLFKSGGHMMGLLFPGSDGNNRIEGDLLPHAPKRLAAGKELTVRSTLIGGTGDSIVPAVQQYVALRGLPPVPKLDCDSYVSLAAGGWMDSKCRESNLFRHAVWPGFGAQPAADAAVFMEWLASQTKRPDLAERLRATARDVIGAVKPADYGTSAVSHVRFPVAPLVFGHVTENAQRAAQHARGLLAQFKPDGSVEYKPGRTDYARTHSSREANGLAAQKVAAALDAACVSGDKELVAAALNVLRALDKFDNTAPRGAQTWEIPLHTPDILASAHLVQAYTRGYELTGEQGYLDRATYWAWTGVPFVYLVNPTPQPVGAYATIAVLGATNWKAPVWFGNPVQWCGLVYADALYRLAPHVPDGPWKQIADGITACGIQFSWPPGDAARQGLLPDFYHLRQQRADGPAINPGTVQANAPRLFNKTSIYAFHAFRANGWYVHAPGTISETNEQPGAVSFKVETWTAHPCHVLVSGVRMSEPRASASGTPSVKVNGAAIQLGAPHQFDAQNGWLVLQIPSGISPITISTLP